MVDIVSRGVVFAPEPETDRQSSAFPDICVLPSGRWVATFRMAPLKSPTAGQRVALCASDDQGASWSEPAEPFAPRPVNGKLGLFRKAALTPLADGRLLASLCWVDHSEPSLPFFNEETEGLLDTRIFFAESSDQGATWSEPVLIDPPPLDVPLPLTGPTLVMPDGALACQFEVNKPYHEPEPWRHRSALVFSQDGGRTWADPVFTSGDPENRVFYWDQRPGVLADGRVLDVF